MNTATCKLHTKQEEKEEIVLKIRCDVSRYDMR